VLCRSSRKKLEEELREVNSKFAEMSSETGEAAIQKLQDEIKSCKSILKCSVCSDRPKEVSVLYALPVYIYKLVSDSGLLALSNPFKVYHCCIDGWWV
jgi:uncharacterized membrane protein (DUF106 family)